MRDVNAPPNCTDARPNVAELWPPNHKLVEIEILNVTVRDDQRIAITILGVWQDEPTNGPRSTTARRTTRRTERVVGTPAALRAGVRRRVNSPPMPGIPG